MTKTRSAKPLKDPIKNRGEFYKRPFDLVILTLAHIALSPIFLLLWIAIPLAIWLDDRGSIFYTQTRLGKGGRVFKLYKFRSMVENAEELTGAVLASGDDPRITRMGRFMRARALDELPQMINLWKGDISLVGPRPERPELAEEIIKTVPGFADRTQVRPGLTGIAQVYGKYATEPRDKIRYDRIYMRRMSPLLDVKLLFLSVWVTLSGKWQAEDKNLR
ncbi:MAG: sugar transferase [SAR202 cluster bacterium]|jgi:lipopolysaccharide/colanic/teichoic acid biosynthesis glycosyltransferase|nr:sugar transferase [SAR202 cluster bacterium]